MCIALGLEWGWPEEFCFSFCFVFGLCRHVVSVAAPRQLHKRLIKCTWLYAIPLICEPKAGVLLQPSCAVKYSLAFDFCFPTVSETSGGPFASFALKASSFLARIAVQSPSPIARLPVPRPQAVLVTILV